MRWAWAWVAVLLAGCGSGGFSKREAEGDGVLRVAMGTNPTTFDPARVQDLDTGALLSQVFEPLLAYDAQNRLVGQLASEWKAEDGGKRYVFTLRDAKFHDGRPVTAEDVRASFTRALNPKLASPTVEYLYDIVGAREYQQGKAETVRGIEVRDPKTIAIQLDAPRPYFLGKLTYPTAFIVPATTPMREISGLKEAIGTGPFRFEAYQPEQQVSMVPWDGYYGMKPQVARLEQPIVKDQATQMNQFKTGETHLMNIPRTILTEVQGDPALKPYLLLQPRPAIIYLGMGPAYAPFKDVRVRQAAQMAIDRDRLCKDVLDGAPPATGLIPPGIPGHRPEGPALRFNPEEAKRLLSEAGFPGGKGLPPLTITYRDQRTDSRLIAEFAGSQLKAIGFPVELRSLEWRTMLERRGEGKLEMFVGSWYGDYLDPENFVSFLLRTGSPQNYDRWSNAEFDRLTTAADREQDETKRIALYQQAETIAMKEAARMPIYWGMDALLVSPKVKGAESNLFGLLPLNRVRLDESASMPK